jgi:hypothetical protein
MEFYLCFLISVLTFFILFAVFVNIHFYSLSVNEKEQHINAVRAKIKTINDKMFTNFIKFNE